MSFMIISKARIVLGVIFNKSLGFSLRARVSWALCSCNLGRLRHLES
jgi:hypothetical protein